MPGAILEVSYECAAGAVLIGFDYVRNVHAVGGKPVFIQTAEIVLSYFCYYSRFCPHTSRLIYEYGRRAAGIRS